MNARATLRMHHASHHGSTETSSYNPSLQNGKPTFIYCRKRVVDAAYGGNYHDLSNEL